MPRTWLQWVAAGTSALTMAACVTPGAPRTSPKAITAPEVAALGPYAAAMTAGDFVFVSGQLPYVAATKSFAPANIRAQTQQALDNVEHLLRAAGSSRERVVKVTIYLADATDFTAMNEIYLPFFRDSLPARTTVPGVNLPPGVLIEIDAIALRGIR